MISLTANMIQVYLNSAPSNIGKDVLIPLVSTFLGAILAFAFNWLLEKKKETSRNFSNYNATFITIESLLNTIFCFKKDILLDRLNDVKLLQNALELKNTLASTGQPQNVIVFKEPLN